MTSHNIIKNSKNAPVLALHASASNGAQWTQLTRDLEGRFEVIAPNMQGQGTNSIEPDLTQNGLASIAGPVISLILKRDQPVHLVGHSNGAGIALKVAIMRPDLVKSLTLYEPSAFHLLSNGDRTDQGLYAEIRQIFEMLTSDQAVEPPVSGMRAFIDFWNGAGTWDQLTDTAKLKLSKSAESVKSDFTRVFSEDWNLNQLKRLTMPNLVMMGMDSPDIAQRVTAMIAGAIPNPTLALLPGLGHMAPVYSPEWVNARIFDHIAKTEKPATNCFWPLTAAA